MKTATGNARSTGASKGSQADGGQGVDMDAPIKAPRTGGDSEDEDEGRDRPGETAKPRTKTFTFRTFSQRVNNIDVDVFRTTKGARSEPLPGYTSFFHENMTYWREVNTTETFVDMWSDLFQMSQTMALLVHYHAEIFKRLIDCLKMDHQLSLEPIFGLLGCLARDLQDEFLPLLPELLDKTAELMEGGGDRSPEALEYAFTCICFVFKHLQRHLVKDLPGVLKMTVGLRYASLDFVRHFACEALAFLFRTSPGPATKLGIKTLLTECALRPSSVVVPTAATLLSETIVGVSQGLHSRAPEILSMVLREDVLRLPAAAAAAEGPVDASPSEEEVRTRVAAVVSLLLDKLLAHTTRGKVSELWAVVLEEARTRLRALDKAPSPEAIASMSRCAFWVAQMVEHARGSRVEDYAPLLALAGDMARHDAFVPGTRAPRVKVAISHAGDEEEERVGAIRNLSFTAQVLRLFAALADGHSKVVGASQGFASLERTAASWGPAFAVPAPSEVLDLCSRLMSNHNIASDAARIFGSHMMAAVLRCLKDREAGAGIEARALQILSSLCHRIEPGIFELQQAAQGQAVGPVPVLMKCRGSPTELLKLIQARTAELARDLQTEADLTTLELVCAYLAVLPFSVTKWQACVSQTTEVYNALRKHVERLSAAGMTDGKLTDKVLTAILVALEIASNLRVRATLCENNDASALVSEILSLATVCPWSLHAVRAAGTAAQLVRQALDRGVFGQGSPEAIAAQRILSQDGLRALLPVFSPNLACLVQPLRVATLRILTAFDQLPEAQGGSAPEAPSAPAEEDEAAMDVDPEPSAPAANGTTSAKKETKRKDKKGKAPSDTAAGPSPALKSVVSTGPASPILGNLYSIQSSLCSLEAGRRAVIHINTAKVHLEYGRVPEELVPAAVHGLLGLLAIRFSVLWTPTIEALGAALQYRTAIAWPIVLAYLKEAQTAFLYRPRPKVPDAIPFTAEGAEEQHLTVDLKPMAFEARIAEAGAEVGGGCTDPMTRLGSAVRAMALVPGHTFEHRSKDWVPVCLEYLLAKKVQQESGAVKAAEEEEDESEDEAEEVEAVRGPGEPSASTPSVRVPIVGGKAWRQQLKTWLEFLGGIKGLKGVFRSQELQIIVSELLLEAEISVQQSVLKCLRAFKFKALTPYIDVMLRLCDLKNLREVLTTYPLQRGAAEGINAEHRPFAVPYFTRALYPFMKKRTGRLGGRGAPGSARAAILNFMAAMESTELTPLLELLLTPMETVFRDPEEAARLVGVPLPKIPSDVEDMIKVAVVPLKRWAPYLAAGQEGAPFWRHMVDEAALRALDQRKRIGYLKSLQDLTTHLGSKLVPLLPALLSILISLMRLSVEAITQEATPGAIAGADAKELRATAFRLFAEILARYSNEPDVYEPFWPTFFQCTTVLASRLLVESTAPKAPPLLECVAALVEEPVLALVLAREDIAGCEGVPSSILGACIAVLGHAQASFESRDTALHLIESLLHHGPDVVRTTLAPHVMRGLEAIRVAIVGGWDAPAARGRSDGNKSARWNLRQLAVLEALATYLDNPTVAEALTDALVPLLVRKDKAGRSKARMREDATVRTLSALASVWTAQGAALRRHLMAKGKGIDVFWSYCATISPLFITLETRDARMALTKAFGALGAEAMPAELGDLATILADINSFSMSEIDEADYDRRTNAYAALKASFWVGLTEQRLAPLLCSVLHDLRNDRDLAIRHAAAHALSEFIDAAKEQGKGQALANVAERLLLTQIRQQLTHPAQAVRQEHLITLRRLVLAFPEVHGELVPLTHTSDPDQDFFLNVANIQLHRRGRTLQRLARQLSEGVVKLSTGTIMGFIVPILQNMITDGRGKETDIGRDLKQTELDQDANVAEHAIRCLSIICEGLPWTQYDQLLNRFLKLLGGKGLSGTHLRLIVKSVCSIVDSFHFEVAGTQDDEGDDEPAAPAGVEKAGEPGAHDEDDDEDADEGAMEVDAEAAAKAAGRVKAQAEQVLASLTRRVLPTLRQHLILDAKTIRAPVAEALVKVIRLLPKAIEAIELPKILQTISNILRSKDHDARSEARSTLVRMVVDLGEAYALPALKVLRTALQPKGYTAHVLSFTVHALLAGYGGMNKAVVLDDAVEEVLAVIEMDIFSDTADEKEVGAIRNATKEAKRCRSFESYELLAKMVSFEIGLPMVLSLARHHLPDADVPALRTKVENLLLHAGRGILANPTASVKDLMIILYEEMVASLERAESVAVKATAEVEAAHSKEMRAVKSGVKPVVLKRGLLAPATPASAMRASRGDHMILEMCLVVLHSSLKKGELGARIKSPEVLSLLDPIPAVLCRCLRSRHTPNISFALKCLSILVSQPLPGTRKAVADINKEITELLKGCPQASHPIAQESLRVLGIMLRDCAAYKPTVAQLRFLLNWAFGDIEETDARGIAFNLLRAVVGRKVVVPEVYDLMSGRIQEMLIRSQSPTVREMCGQVLLQFLLDYPVGERRVQQHIEFLITNLQQYEHESGRLAAAEFLRIVITKFPAETLESVRETILLPLVTRMASDGAAAVRNAAVETLRSLFGRCPSLIDKTFDYCVSWLESGNATLVRTACQMVSILVQTQGAKALPRLPGVVGPVLLQLAASSEEEWGEDEGGEPTGPSDDQWQGVYAGLSLLEKLAHHLPEFLVEPIAEDSEENGLDANALVVLWEVVSDLCTYPHTWVRKAATRLVGFALNTSEGLDILLPEAERTQRAGALALRMWIQFEECTEDEHLTQVLRILVSLPKYLDVSNRGRKVRAEGEDEDEEEEDEDQDQDEEAERGLCLHGLVRRIVRTASDKSFPKQKQRMAALKWIAAAGKSLPDACRTELLALLFKPLYLAIDGANMPSDGSAHEVQILAQDVMEALRGALGSNTILAAYSAARDAIKAVRSERKKRKAQEAILDPELRQFKKQKKMERKQVGKKRKLEEVRVKRSQGLAIKNKKPRHLDGGGGGRGRGGGGRGRGRR